MSWNRLESLLKQLFEELNRENAVLSPQELWGTYQAQIEPLRSQYPEEFVELSRGLWLPKAIETARILSKLRQRFNATQEGRDLTGRIRAEVLLRKRPTRNIGVETLKGEERSVADVAANQNIRAISNFSQFQIDGWKKSLHAIRNHEGMVIVAPTGSGKTEVFLLPLIYEIARQIRSNPKNPPRFILLYPRVALLKDQLSRIFRYVYQAEQNTESGQLELFTKSQKVSEGITIGFQFSGIGSEVKYTLDNNQIFDNKRFKVLQDECCPVCSQGDLIYNKKRGSVTTLECNNESCGAVFRVSIAKNDHAKYKPHILVTTAESLDRLYLNPKQDFEEYLTSLTGVLFDEVHLYHSLYGAHIHHLVQRLENLTGNRLSKIAASATVANPERFASKFFYGGDHHSVTVHDASDKSLYPSEPSGLEVIYFLQSPEEANRPGAAPTLIQSAMAVGHGLFTDGERKDRAIIFTESLDLANRLYAQIRDAESNRLLWDFRTALDNIEFQNQRCPNTQAGDCLSHYLEGECWRGILGGANCVGQIAGFRERSLEISYVSSQQKASYWEGDMVVATPALEVGVDDERIRATFHYRPPQSIFSFIQRRGRAGRSADSIAYTLLILANSASDHFYFFRRHRLIYGSYELPLNPNNPVLRDMHKRIAQERERMRYWVQRRGVQGGILDWIWEKLEECSVIRKYFETWLNEYINEANKERQKHLKQWIKEERKRYESYLNLQWTLVDIQEESPDVITPQIQQVNNLISRYLEGDTEQLSEIRSQLRSIRDRLGDLIIPANEEEEIDADSIKALRELRDRVENAWTDLVQQAQTGVGFQQADNFYNFFNTLEEFNARDKYMWILNSAPDVLKTVLQALFYLPQSDVDFFIPNAYFNEVKPITVAVRKGEKGKNQRIQLKQEDTTKLSTMLLPYRTAYRYHSHPFLSVVETEHDPQWARASWQQGGSVGVRLLGEGVHLTGQTREFRPEKLYVKALKSDREGKQIVKMCPECFAVYSENRTRRCHGQSLRSVRLYAEANIERTYGYQPELVESVSTTLGFVSELSSEITVHGSVARVETKVWIGEYISPRGSRPWTFDAFYVDRNGEREPVRYGLQTKGIVWHLQEACDRLLQNEQLKQQVERTQIEGRNKVFDKRLILHTASHMLQKAIASISGVNEQVLEYCFREDCGEVVVWERYEGGSGISEVFVEALRSNRTDVYQELLASVFCPVNLGERTDWSTPNELRNELINTWNLHQSSDFTNAIIGEATAERNTESRVQARQNGDDTPEVEIPLQCQRLDGCPACLYTNNCTERFEQTHAVSHLVAEALMKELGTDI